MVLDAMVKEIVDQTDSRLSRLYFPVTAFGAMGPQLFWARDGDGRWIPYDTEATDENRECLVRERDWPWCWGDVVWAAGFWVGQPTYLRWELDGFGELFVGAPPRGGAGSSFSGLGGLTRVELARFVQSRSVAESTRSSTGQLPMDYFWERLPPPPKGHGTRDAAG